MVEMVRSGYPNNKQYVSNVTGFNHIYGIIWRLRVGFSRQAEIYFVCVYIYMYIYTCIVNKKKTCQNPTAFSSGYRKSECQWIHAGKRFPLEEEAVGTALSILYMGQVKHTLRLSVHLDSWINQIFICLFY